MLRPHLNRKLTLEAPDRTADAAGGFTETWVPLGTLWAEIKSRAGRETAESGAPISRVGFEINVRGAPIGSPERPLPQQRFREGTRIYTIQAVAEYDPLGRYLTCYADEEVVV